ncbi:MAG TPA: hypothetical protein PLU30_08115 [Verrucomicrobiae bacterium]|nr:hypothetical protein [Verrucomicrobiae bacterium]
MTFWERAALGVRGAWLGARDRDLRGLHPLLRDCPFAPVVLGRPQPRRLVVIGSGLTQCPEAWLRGEDIGAVFVNDKMLGVGSYSHLAPYAIVTRKSPTAGIVEDFALRHPARPLVFVFDSGKGARMLRDEGARVFNFPVNRGRDGAWFEAYNRAVRRRSGNTGLRLTTGFYITLWLLSGAQEEITITGFDGHRGLKDTSEYQFMTRPADRMDPRYHDLSFEWIFMEAAVEIARRRGVRVNVARGEGGVT